MITRVLKSQLRHIMRTSRNVEEKVIEFFRYHLIVINHQRKIWIRDYFLERRNSERYCSQIWISSYLANCSRSSCTERWREERRPTRFLRLRVFSADTRSSQRIDLHCNWKIWRQSSFSCKGEAHAVGIFWGGDSEVLWSPYSPLICCRLNLSLNNSEEMLDEGRTEQLLKHALNSRPDSFYACYNISLLYIKKAQLRNREENIEVRNFIYLGDWIHFQKKAIHYAKLAQEFKLPYHPSGPLEELFSMLSSRSIGEAPKPLDFHPKEAMSPWSFGSSARFELLNLYQRKATKEVVKFLWNF